MVTNTGPHAISSRNTSVQPKKGWEHLHEGGKDQPSEWLQSAIDDGLKRHRCQVLRRERKSASPAQHWNSF